MKRNKIIYCLALLTMLIMTVLLFSGCKGKQSFELLSPADEESGVSLNPQISWTAAADATQYVVKISTDENFVSVVHQQIVSGTSYSCAKTLDPETTYFLRIYVLSNDGKSLGERVDGRFTTVKPQYTVDYSVTRILHDFDNITEEELAKLFAYREDGDPLYASLAMGEGADGTNGMRLTYGAKGIGWSCVQRSDSSDKMIWTGTKGIRFWIGGKRSRGEISVLVGNDNSQEWKATLTFNGDASYVSIPWTAFEFIGEGSDAWDLSQMTKLGFHFTGESGDEIIIDDVTIGSDSPHSADTRYLVEKFKSAEAGIFENFESIVSLDDIYNGIYFENVKSADFSTENPYEGDKSLEIVSENSGWAIVGKKISAADFSRIKSLSFQASAGEYVVGFASAGGSVMTASTIVFFDGGDAGVNLEDLVINEGGVNCIEEIDRVYIACKTKSGTAVYLDNIVLSAEEFVPSGVIENFEGNSKSILSCFNILYGASAKNASIVDLDESMGGTKGLKITANKSFTLQLKGYNLENYDFSNVNGLKLKVKMLAAGTLTVKIGSYQNCVTYTQEFTGTETGATEIICDFDSMLPADDNVTGALQKNNINFFQITFSTDDNSYEVYIDDIEFYTN